MTPDPAVNRNLKEGIFFHAAKSEEARDAILKQGLRTSFSDEDGRWQAEGNLGVAAYVSCDWKMAFWFGRILFEATLQRGTRILDARPQADSAVLAYLKREFHANIVEGPDVTKFIPGNKHLKLEELVALVRHFYYNCWSKDWGKDKTGMDRWPLKRRRSLDALRSCVSMLKKAGFHGYGDPASDNGIAIWASDRVKIVRVVRSLDPTTHMNLIDDSRLAGMTLEEFEKKVGRHTR